jgi:ATP adenylyltransferase
LNILYAPWRTTYTQQKNNTASPSVDENSCPFCQHLQQEEDEKNYIFRRFTYSIIMLNQYPYNAGHLLILPKKHTGHLEDLSIETRSELMELVTFCSTTLRDVLGCAGINIGINLGQAAGPSIATHLHFHVLPRWHGDTNFMPTLADTKVVSFDLSTMYQQLKPHIQKLKY